MRREIREQLERKYKEMAEPQVSVNFTPEQLQKILEQAISSATKMNPLEQKKFNEEMEKDRRRNLLAIELGRAEEEARWRKQNGCSHCRDGRTGNGVPRGTGEWTTCGQLHGPGEDLATMICQRCGTPWTWKPTAQEKDYIRNVGMLGMAPPAIDRCLNKEDFVERPKPRVESLAV